MRRLTVLSLLVLAAIVGCSSHPVDTSEERPSVTPEKQYIHFEANCLRLPAKQAFGMFAENLTETALVNRVDGNWADGLVDDARKSGALSRVPALMATSGQPCSISIGETESFVVDVERVDGEWRNVMKDLESGVRIELSPMIREDQTIEIGTRVTVTEIQRPVATFTTDVGSGDGSPRKTVTIDLPEQSVRRSRQPIVLPDGGKFLVGILDPRAVKDDPAGDAQALLIVVEAKIVEPADAADERLSALDSTAYRRH